MVRLRSIVATASCAAVLLPVCAPDATSQPMVGSVDDLAAVRVRNFNFAKSFNRTVGQAGDAIQDGASSVGASIVCAVVTVARASSSSGIR